MPKLQGLSNPYRRTIYEALPEDERDAFRICRDLAKLPTPEREPLTFFVSCNHLGDRLRLHPPEAQRILRKFEKSYGLVKLLESRARSFKVAYILGIEPLALLGSVSYHEIRMPEVRRSH